jgi:hypothetical protein
LRQLLATLRSIPKDFLVFLAATAFFSFSQGIFDSVFNNYLCETFRITDFRRSIMEVPRERYRPRQFLFRVENKNPAKTVVTRPATISK